MHTHDTVTSSITCVCGQTNTQVCITCYQAIHNCNKGGIDE